MRRGAVIDEAGAHALVRGVDRIAHAGRRHLIGAQVDGHRGTVGVGREGAVRGVHGAEFDGHAAGAGAQAGRRGSEGTAAEFLLGREFGDFERITALDGAVGHRGRADRRVGQRGVERQHLLIGREGLGRSLQRGQQGFELPERRDLRLDRGLLGLQIGDRLTFDRHQFRDDAIDIETGTDTWAGNGCHESNSFEAILAATRQGESDDQAARRPPIRGFADAFRRWCAPAAPWWCRSACQPSRARCAALLPMESGGSDRRSSNRQCASRSARSCRRSRSGSSRCAS